MALLFFPCASIICWVAPNSVAAVTPGCGPADGAGRYVVPLVDALPFLIATLIIFPGLQQSQAQQGADARLALRFTSSRKLPSLASIQVGLLVVLSLYFGVQGIAYAQADPN